MKQVADLIEHAIAEAKAGNKAGARRLLAQVIRQEPRNVQAWYLLSRLVEEKEQVIYCLERALKITPDSPQAKARLKKMREAPTSQAFTPAPTRQKIGTEMHVLIGAAAVIRTGMLLIAVFLGGFALRSRLVPTSIGFFQVLQAENPTTSPALATADVSSQHLTETTLPAPTATAMSTLTPLPSPSPSHTALPLLSGAAACIPAEAHLEAGLVTRVIDGDTIEVMMNGQTYRVRYIGIDSPETYDPQTGSQPFGPEAADKNREFVNGREIILVKDVSETDSFGRLLRYVFVGGLSGIFVNYEMVASGYAVASSYPPDVACNEVFLSAEEMARSSEIGLWAPVPILIPTEPAVGEQRGNCDPAYPDVCIPPPPPDLDCKDIPFRRFRVIPPDPHHFDRDVDGIGCER